MEIRSILNNFKGDIGSYRNMKEIMNHGDRDNQS